MRLMFWINSVKSIRRPALLGRCLIETGPQWVSSAEQQPVQITSASLSSASHLLTFPPLPDKMCFCVAPLHQRHKCYSSVLSIHSECRNVAHLQPAETGSRKLFFTDLFFPFFSQSRSAFQQICFVCKLMMCRALAGRIQIYSFHASLRRSLAWN